MGKIKIDKFSLAFSVSNLGPKSFQRAVSKFGSPESAWKGKELGFDESGIRGVAYDKFHNFRKKFKLDTYIEKLGKENVEFISFFDKRYPKGLKKMENPPIGLFCKGNLSPLNHKPSLAVVGTRKVTEYGKSITATIVSGLSHAGLVIISGLALGVDSIAHRVTLDNKGETIAVLGCGVDCCRPAENYSLYKRILDNNGLVISEYALSVLPNQGTFPARNRIIAALSDGVLVTEAAEDSGSLITADYGVQFGKPIFAVPGQATSKMSEGSIKLLKQGAHLVTNNEDVLREFSISSSQFSMKTKIKNLKLSKEERRIVSLLQSEEMNIDELTKKLKFPVSEMFIYLSNLELRGVIKNRGGKFGISM